MLDREKPGLLLLLVGPGLLWETFRYRLENKCFLSHIIKREQGKNRGHATFR